MNFFVGASFNRADVGIEQRRIDAAINLLPVVYDSFALTSSAPSLAVNRARLINQMRIVLCLKFPCIGL